MSSCPIYAQSKFINDVSNYSQDMEMIREILGSHRGGTLIGGATKEVTLKHVVVVFLVLSSFYAGCVYKVGFSEEMNFLFDYLSHLKVSMGASLFAAVGIMFEDGSYKHVKGYDFFGKMNLILAITGRLMEYIKQIKNKGVTCETVLPGPFYTFLHLIINHDTSAATEQVKQAVAEAAEKKILVTPAVYQAEKELKDKLLKAHVDHVIKDEFYDATDTPSDIFEIVDENRIRIGNVTLKVESIKGGRRQKSLLRKPRRNKSKKIKRYIRHD